MIATARIFSRFFSLTMRSSTLSASLAFTAFFADSSSFFSFYLSLHFFLWLSVISFQLFRFAVFFVLCIFSYFATVYLLFTFKARNRWFKKSPPTIIIRRRTPRSDFLYELIFFCFRALFSYYQYRKDTCCANDRAGCGNYNYE